ncbi:hypothetical protein RIU93_09620 [Staphylococcus warneri]|uniref:hypothetical protein n=1 Tax=Staphylococcus warneri TaxID=1292 RepID=UPI00066C5183|nr:hypothetical protein [Staphylococcus warneri]AXZ22712.1 hypothetical protein D3P10_02840 [Staphylococcus warneri]KTW05334.1 hypothetical protein NS346_11350 [Staphylococcus warneri]OIS42469.1 hypothetical protein A4A23_09860 [Staphylococcus warneri]OIS47176.1 hypothetical protein A4A24_04600 [Staphylococcus warneri]PTI08742.1 hypothetical protein BU088_01120 [Staphylococcus warneri]
MSESIRYTIQNELLDLYDDVKVGLSDLNEQKSLTINGPASKLFKRATRMSYIQGQKQAIDEMNQLLETYDVDEQFLEHYNQLASRIRNDNIEKVFSFSNLTDIPSHFEETIADLYFSKGQNFIIKHINSIME